MPQKGYHMRVKVELPKCVRCGHLWKPRKDGTPLRCAKCRSPYWNRLKVR